MQEFSFENIYWMLLIIIIPIIYFLYKNLFKKNNLFNNKLELFADKKLLPHLVRNYSALSSNKNKILFWSLLWVLAIIAISGPRWGYDEVETYSNNDSLVILLDLSKSMNASDIKPSRIKRATQEIEDILRLKDQDLKVALIGFSSIPHLISPLTFDSKTINNLLPYIDTNLVNLEGSNLNKAIAMAEKLFSSGNYLNKSILVMSDGGFDSSVINISSDVSLSFMGFGTKEGAPILDKKGNFIKKDDKIIIDKLQSDAMGNMTKNGGRYITASFLDNDTNFILNFVKDGAKEMDNVNDNKFIYYNEIFYVPLILMMILMLFLFQKGIFVILIMILFLPSKNLSAAIFLNKQQEAKQAFDNQDYETAIEKFDDHYQKGVTLYRAKKYKEAQKEFANLNDSKSKYNLGNSFFKQNKFKEAIKSYEESLKINPQDEDAKFNIKLARKMLKQQSSNQKNQQSDNKNNNQEDQQDSKDSNKADQDNSSSKNASNQNNQEKDSKRNDNYDDKEDSQNKSQESDNQQNMDSKEEGKIKNKDTQDQEDNSEELENNEPNNQRDFNADKQLNRIKTNNGNILKNQFYIEEQQFLHNKND